MTESRKLALVRAVSAVLLLALTVGVISYAEKMRILKIKTSNSRLPYLYSDEEMQGVLMPQDTATDIFVQLGLYDKKYDIDAEFVDFCAENEQINLDGTFLTALKSRLESGRYSDDVWESLTGYTFSVLYDIYTGAVERGEVDVIGDVFDQNKTSVSLFGMSDRTSDTSTFPFAGELAELVQKTNVIFEVGSGTRFFISGGLKFAFCRDAENVTEAKKVCDIVIAESQTETDAAIFAEVGADVVFVTSGNTRAEYIGDCTVLYGVGEISSQSSMLATVTLAVGMDPIVRLYPCVLSDGKAVLADENARAELIAAANALSETAVIDENGRIKYK